MSIYNPIYNTSFVDATLAEVNSNSAGIGNVFITTNDLIKTGINSLIFVAPNGSKWKKTVDNTGAFVTAAV